MTTYEALFWMEKLAAFLHDPPDKCLDIGGHFTRAQTFLSGAGFHDPDHRKKTSDCVKPADFFDAAAQRFGFPKVKCSASFAENPDRAFIHPLSSSPIAIPPGMLSQAGLAQERIQAAIQGIESDDWRKRFFLYWRRWQENATSVDPNLAYLPADTRIPDHSIWAHMTMASAVAGCKGKPAMLLFQFGPVQDFIAQARSMRDLWSGSYLISWLMAHAMKAISDVVGPDAIIFPNLRGNGIFDALHKDDIYSTKWADGKGGHDTTWQRICEGTEGGVAGVATWLLTPTLPNRFLALVPEARATELAQTAEASIRTELAKIGEAVWAWLLTNGAQPNWKARWDAQITAFPQTAWAVQPWLDRQTCMDEAARLPDKGVAVRLQAVFDLAEKKLPEEDRDERYYNPAKTKLNNAGILWSAHYALVDAKLAARRNTRDFAAWNNPMPEVAVKDSLSGKEECIGNEEFWKTLTSQHKDIFKAASHRYGAMNLIKRLWCRVDDVPFIPEKLGIDAHVIRKALHKDSTQDIAAENENGSPYIAVLALDGDEMGKWVSGEKAPRLIDQLAPKAREYLVKLGAAQMNRLLTPAYHLQFSEALSNFAIWKARQVVKEHEGELIYAGGDDVLAILPSTRAIACAEALRNAFRTDYENARLYPGSKCDVSVGLAIGHQNAPLQMLVREAQRAEKMAKTRYERGALAINLYKRSGEIIEWGTKWDNKGGLPLMKLITNLMQQEKLSGRFPYALAALLQPYDLEKDEQEGIKQVIQHEVRYVLSRQGQGLSSEELKDLTQKMDQYLDTCQSESGVFRLGSFLPLFLCETFINRVQGEC